MGRRKGGSPEGPAIQPGLGLLAARARAGHSGCDRRRDPDEHRCSEVGGTYAFHLPDHRSGDQGRNLNLASKYIPFVKAFPTNVFSTMSNETAAGKCFPMMSPAACASKSMVNPFVRVTTVIRKIFITPRGNRVDLSPAKPGAGSGGESSTATLFTTTATDEDEIPISQPSSPPPAPAPPPESPPHACPVPPLSTAKITIRMPPFMSFTLVTRPPSPTSSLRASTTPRCMSRRRREAANLASRKSVSLDDMHEVCLYIEEAPICVGDEIDDAVWPHGRRGSL
ncbi:hypothetical protein BDK51DRAFT_47043 [Blyttiomyces helicus]|uniref:Uncharacterized protein n=1 Tax=Blyttiomyces helicus TaxID=388810 RepID=A0A4P9W487_9FUNG|nr:hypothetical protein BDK51DRAFT_47043 [Blyttiomyces helicus]|eukprot:RKO85490.1 hypothetical protein BDK51DRAFT_47043 [Blyttiomyces helicus]